MFSTQKIKAHYDRSTSLFLQLGDNGATQNIHRVLWGEGVEEKADAVNYVNELIYKELSELVVPKGKVLDLGCGVGSTLFYLAKRRKNWKFEGVSISQKQIEIAKAAAKSNRENLAFYQGDFQDLPSSVTAVDFAYSIEAFVHASQPELFFKELSRVLNAEGRVVLIDDFRAEKNADFEVEKIESTLKKFQDGWMVNSLLTVETVSKLAAEHQLKLVKNEDLSPWLDLNRPRDRFIKLMVNILKPFLKYSSYLKSLEGGDALQTALSKGWLEYRLLVFEKTI